MSRRPLLGAVGARVAPAFCLAVLCVACGGSGVSGGSNGSGGVTAPVSTGSLAVFAGNPVDGGLVDGSGTAARFIGPTAMTIDAAGNLYLGATCSIRKITPAGLASTFAGSFDTCGNVDAAGNPAGFPSPGALAAAADGRLFITSGRKVIEVGPAGALRTVAVLEIGNQVDGRAAALFSGGGIAVDAAGNLIVANGIGTRRISPSGAVTMLEGVASMDNVSGTHLAVRRGVAVDAAGTVYLAALDNTILRIDTAGKTTVLAGTPNAAGASDGSGTAARFTGVVALALDGQGNLYAADAAADGPLIRKITPAGVVSTVAGRPGVNLLQPGALPGGLAPLGGLVSDGKGNLYASSGNAVVKISLP